MKQDEKQRGRKLTWRLSSVNEIRATTTFLAEKSRQQRMAKPIIFHAALFAFCTLAADDDDDDDDDDDGVVAGCGPA